MVVRSSIASCLPFQVDFSVSVTNLCVASSDNSDNCVGTVISTDLSVIVCSVPFTFTFSITFTCAPFSIPLNLVLSSSVKLLMVFLVEYRFKLPLVFGEPLRLSTIVTVCAVV